MNERITLISILDDSNIEKINYYVKQIDDKLCKVPFGKVDDSREKMDTLLYHFTLSAWDILDKEKVINELVKLDYPKLRLLVNGIEIMNGKEKSYVLYFSIDDNEELKLLQEKIYKILPSEKYNPQSF